LYEFNNVLDVTYGAYVVNGAYGRVNNSNGSTTQAPARNQVVAVIRELLAMTLQLFGKAPVTPARLFPRYRYSLM